MRGATFRRRTVVSAIGAGLLFGGSSGSSAAADDAMTDEPTVTPDLTAFDGAGVETRKVLATDLDSGVEVAFDSLAAVDPDSLPAGEYRITHERVTPDQVERVVDHVTVTDGRFEIAEETPELLVTIDEDRGYDPDSELRVWVSAVDSDGSFFSFVDDPGPIDITLRDPDGTVVDAATVTESGTTLVTLDLDTVEGDHDLEVEWLDAELLDVQQVTVGPLVEFSFPSGTLTPNEEVAIGMSRTQDYDPVPGDTTVDIERPDGDTDTVSVDVNDGGVGLVEFTPDSEGEYRLTHPEAGFGRTTDAVEHRVFSPGFRLRNQSVNEPIEFAGHLVGGSAQPLADELIEVQLLDDAFGGDVIATETATTSEFGQFRVKFDPQDAPGRYGLAARVDPEESDRPVHLTTDRLTLVEEAAPDPSLDVDLETEEFTMAPGGDFSVEITVEDAAGDPVSGAEVNIYERVGFRGAIFDIRDETTDADGTVSYSGTIPDPFVEDERFRVEAATEVDGDVLQTNDSVTVASIDVGIDTPFPSPQAGDTFDVDITAEDAETGEPVPGVDVGFVPGRDYVRGGNFDIDSGTTDGAGETTFEVTLPSDARYRWRANTVVRPYREISLRRVPSIRPFNVDISVSDEPAPGDTITVEYSITENVDTASRETAAVVVFDTALDAQVAIADAGETVTFDVPDHSAGETERIEAVVVDAEGNVSDGFESFSVADEPVITDQVVEFVNPTGGDSITAPEMIEATVDDIQLGPPGGDANHLHLLVDEPFVDMGEPIPFAGGYYHLATGGTTRSLNKAHLPPGDRTIGVQVSDGFHTAVDAPTDTVNVTVEGIGLSELEPATVTVDPGDDIDLSVTADSVGVSDDQALTARVVDVPISVDTNDASFAFDNVGNDAYIFGDEVAVNPPEARELTSIGEENPTITLDFGVRCVFNVAEALPAHPIEFLDSDDNILLSQDEDTTGSFEDDDAVAWNGEGPTAEFTLTRELAAALDSYRCVNHPVTMTGSIETPTVATETSAETGTLSAGTSETVTFDSIDTEALAEGTYVHEVVGDDDVVSGEFVLGTPDVADYADEEGIVQISGVLQAVDDYGQGDIDIGLMLEVVNAYSSGEPVA